MNITTEDILHTGIEDSLTLKLTMVIAGATIIIRTLRTSISVHLPRCLRPDNTALPRPNDSPPLYSHGNKSDHERGPVDRTIRLQATRICIPVGCTNRMVILQNSLCTCRVAGSHVHIAALENEVEIPDSRSQVLQATKASFLGVGIQRSHFDF